MTTRATRPAKWPSASREWQRDIGKIRRNDDSSDVFVHHSEVYADGFRSLAVGEKLEFYMIKKDGRKEAVMVTGPGGAFVKGQPGGNRWSRSGGHGSGGGGGGGHDGGYGYRGGGNIGGKGHEAEAEASTNMCPTSRQYLVTAEAATSEEINV